MTFGRVGSERIVAAVWGIALTAVLAVLIVFGSRNLHHFDAALVGYTFAVLFSTFAISYRYAMWLQRPPTKLYWRRGWQVFFRGRWLGRNAVEWVSTSRSTSRSTASSSVAIGCAA